jgi:hypothetical protein
VKLALSTLKISAALAIAAAIPIFLIWGVQGGLGLALGFTTAILSILSFGLLAYAFGEGTGPQTGTRLTLALWLVKLPVIYTLVWLATALGAHAIGCFLAGLVLVYSALIFSALRAR